MDWTRIKKEYITSNASLRMLAEKHRVSLSTAKDRCHTEGWVESRRQFRRKTTEKLIETESERESKYRMLVYSIAETMLQSISKLIDDPDCALKPREITGALKDLKDILDIRSADDLKEQRARIAKLEKEMTDTAEETKITVKFDGLPEGWTA